MTKKPLSREAHFMRARRALARQGKDIHRCRSVEFLEVTGRYFMTDRASHEVTDIHVDIEELSRTLGLIKPYEYLVSA
jgi:hypothetical protein